MPSASGAARIRCATTSVSSPLPAHLRLSTSPRPAAATDAGARHTRLPLAPQPVMVCPRRCWQGRPSRGTGRTERDDPRSADTHRPPMRSRQMPSTCPATNGPSATPVAGAPPASVWEGSGSSLRLALLFIERRLLCSLPQSFTNLNLQVLYTHAVHHFFGLPRRHARLHQPLTNSFTHAGRNTFQFAANCRLVHALEFCDLGQGSAVEIVRRHQESRLDIEFT